MVYVIGVIPTQGTKMRHFGKLTLVGLFLSLPMAAQALEVQSQNPGLLAQAVTEVGHNPTTGSDENACFPASDDFSESGKVIASQSWIITSEITAHGMEFVGFAGRAEELGGGACAFSDGYVSVYRDGAFVALIENASTDAQLLATIFSADDGSITIKGSDSGAVTGRIRYDAAKDLLLVTLP